MRLAGSPAARRPLGNAAAGTFNMLVLGDSYAWQPGLSKSEKTFSLIAAQMTDELLNFRIVNTPRYFARSGADIGEPDDTYEKKWLDLDAAAPWPGGNTLDGLWDDPQPNGVRDYAAPSAWRQMERAMLARNPGDPSPANVDLIILSGGGNDVGITHSMNPFEGQNDHQNVRDRIQRFCGGRMCSRQT